MSDRQVGALLSGGFDSSIVCAILVKIFGITNLQTFSVGLEGSPDLKYAREPKGKIQRGKVIGEKSLKMRTKRPESSNDGWPE